MAPETPSFQGWRPFLQPFSASVTGVQLVPELDVLLVLLPAQEDFSPINDGREINQPALKILHLDLPSLKFQQHRLKGDQLSNPTIHQFAAEVATRNHQPAEALLYLMHFRLQFRGARQPLPDLRQQAPGFVAGIMLLELPGHGD